MESSGLSESYVQVAADGSGKKIRNRPLVVQLEDGTLDTVYMQVVAIGDRDGNLIDLAHQEYQAEVLKELRAIVRGLQEITNETLYE